MRLDDAEKRIAINLLRVHCETLLREAELRARRFVRAIETFYDRGTKKVVWDSWKMVENAGWPRNMGTHRTPE